MNFSNIDEQYLMGHGAIRFFPFMVPIAALPEKDVMAGDFKVYGNYGFAALLCIHAEGEHSGDGWLILPIMKQAIRRFETMRIFMQPNPSQEVLNIIAKYEQDNRAKIHEGMESQKRNPPPDPPRTN